MNELDGDVEFGFVKTTMHLEDEYAERLEESLNEFYLWHGSSPAAVAGISADGFKLSMAGSHAGTMSRIPGVLVAISFMVPEGSRLDEQKTIGDRGSQSTS